MRTVLCFGDSITWGYNAADESRFPWETRWPCSAGTPDGVHPDQAGHAALGEALEAPVRALFG